MEPFNNINLKEQFLKMYVKEAPTEELQQINLLLEQGSYKQIDKIVEEYTRNIINNKDLKSFDSGNPSGGGMSIIAKVKEYSTEDMDSEAFKLYCILMLIDEYEKEIDQNKKELLHNEIQIAINRYRSLKEIASGKLKK